MQNNGLPPASSGHGEASVPAELLDKEVNPEADVDKQRLIWEAIDEKRQVWDSIDEQQKLRNKEERKQKQEERRQKQEDKKRRKLEVEVRRKEIKDSIKKSVKIRESKMVRAEGGGSPSATKLSQRVTGSPLARLPLVSSPAVNMLRSRIGILASVAASKRRRSLSERDESSPSQKRAKSSGRSPSASLSPSMSLSPSPTTSLLGGSRKKHSRGLGRKVRRLTSTIWRDFNPYYDRGILVEAECKHCNF